MIQKRILKHKQEIILKPHTGLLNMLKILFKKLILYGFKIQAAAAAKKVLIHHYKTEEVKKILHEYWQEYLKLKPEIPTLPTLGGTLMVHLAAMSTAFYQELTLRAQY